MSTIEELYSVSMDTEISPTPIEQLSTNSTMDTEARRTPPQAAQNCEVAEEKDNAEKAVDMIIDVSDRLNKFFWCNPCNKYRLQQLAYEQKAEQKTNFDVAVYKTFFMDD